MVYEIVVAQAVAHNRMCIAHRNALTASGQHLVIFSGRIALEEIPEPGKRLYGHQLHIVMALLKVYDGTCGREIESPRHTRKKTPVSLLI